MKKLPFVFFSFCLSFSAAANQIYTWVDDEGTRHYSYKAPVDYPYEELGAANQITVDPEVLAAMQRTSAETSTEMSDTEMAAAIDALDDKPSPEECSSIQEGLTAFEERQASGDGGELTEDQQDALNQLRARLNTCE